MKLNLSLAGIVLGFLYFFTSCESKNTREQQSEADIPEQPAQSPDFSGRLYTAGLNREEVEKLRLTWPVYQITGAENYFFSAADSLKSYIGRCIGIKGEILESWKNAASINDQYTYNRKALQIKEILLLPAENCSTPEVASENRIISGIRKQYRGIPVRMVRPAPDIAYDYALRLKEPFHDEFNQMEPNKLITEIPIEVYEPGQIHKIEKAIKQEKMLEIRASLVHGYAESPALQVEEISAIE